MENTMINRFGADEAAFFLVGAGGGFEGPFRPSEIQRRLEAREVSWVDHCYREADAAWMRICDHPVFRAGQPETPRINPVTKAVPPPVPAEARVPRVRWFLYQNESQSGPYPEIEIKRLVRTGQVGRSAFVWQEAFTDWKPVSEVPEFRTDETDAMASVEDRRSSPRKPLVARIYLTNDREIASGMCRDISVGGMQVLTDGVPGNPGDRIHLNVMPPDATMIAPFVAHGVIVRILEDGRGFSFRFTELSAEAKEAIERYIS